MTERNPSRSSRAGNRGRHRHVDSPETRAWEEIAPAVDAWPEPEPKPKRDRHGIRILGATAAPEPQPSPEPAAADPARSAELGRKRKRKLKPPPAQPPWMDAGEYAALLELREGLE